MASPYNTDSSSQTLGNDVQAFGADKRLTVTFRDVDVEVDGLGEDYGMTVASAAASLLPSRKSRKSRRVCNQTPAVTLNGLLVLTLSLSTSSKASPGKYVQGRW
jgi:hypothetical protein